MDLEFWIARLLGAIAEHDSDWAATCATYAAQTAHGHLLVVAVKGH